MNKLNITKENLRERTHEDLVSLAYALIEANDGKQAIIEAYQEDLLELKAKLKELEG